MNQKTGKTEIVIDITIEVNEKKTVTYVILENLSVTYAGNLILSTDKMSLASEIKAMKNTARGDIVRGYLTVGMRLRYQVFWLL